MRRVQEGQARPGQPQPHSKAAPYEAFAPEEARRLAQALELHFTPKHGSWLNAVELEFSAPGSQCLDRPVASLEELRHGLGAGQDEGNARKTRVGWTFDVPAASLPLVPVVLSECPAEEGLWGRG